MAEENVVKTNIVATSDMSGLIGDLNKVSLALSQLQERLTATNKGLAVQAAVMNKAFAETLRSTGQFSTHFVSLTSDVDKFGQQLDRGQLKLGQFFRVYGEHVKTSGGVIRDLAKQQVMLQNSILQPLGRNAEGLMQYNVHIPRGLDLVKNKTAVARQELAIMNRVVQEGAGQLINWGKNTQWAGRQLTVGLTIPLAAFGKAAADAFRTADQELVRLTKVYGGLSAVTSAELAKVRKDVATTASELSRGYGASFTETISLAADIAATGKEGNELLGSVKETTRLAVLGEVDRQEAMKATLAIQTAFKQNTEELSDSINFLNAVENQTSTTLQDLVEAIPKAGPIIKGLGGSVQDLALYLTAMREGGVSASEGANALKSALGALINPTKVATGMFAGFGIDLKGIVQKNAGDVTATILELQAALDKLDPLQKQQALEQLFGKFQFARMNALFSNLGKQGSQTLQVMDLMKASSQDLANVASRELAQVTESASGRYRRALEGLKADLAGVGEQFLKINTALINIISNIVKFAGDLPGPIKAALSFFGMLTAVAGPLIMLTGVLGNFFGYIIKGVFHFKALFKGAEGWKLLTPEILAANKAGSMAEQVFYSDAKAAAILNQALQGLIASYQTLETHAASGGISTVMPTVPGGGPGREVNPTSPYITKIDTRHFAHMNPVSMMTSAEKAQQSIFGVVPGPQTINQRISNMPQVYMTEDMPPIQGVTAAGKVSTGVIAGEAAKFHALTGALGMQTGPEIKRLRAEIARTGLITDELAQSYEALLPKMQEITTNAANRTKQIVAELQANKINADQARAQIVALNREIETMMVSAAQQTAAGLGRNINVTQLPLLNQPAFDPRTGKSNMKELFREKRGTRQLLNNIAQVLGVRTFGAGYSIETTRPKKMNVGGYVFTANDGNIVPGPNINADIVPAILTPGEFVVNAEATRRNLPLLQAINGAGATGNRLVAGSRSPLAGLERGHLSNDLSAFLMYMDTATNQRIIQGRRYKNFDGITGFEIAQSLSTLKQRTGMHPMSILNNLVGRMGGDSRYVQQVYRSLMADLVSPENKTRVFGGTTGESFENLAEKHIKILQKVRLPDGSNVYDTLKRVKTLRGGASGRGKSLGLLLDDLKYGKDNVLRDTKGKPIMRALLGTSSGFKGSVIDDLFKFSLGPNPERRGASVESHGRARTFLGMPLEKTRRGWAMSGTGERLRREAMSMGLFRNKGGIIPGRTGVGMYNRGGKVPGYQRGGMVGSMLGQMLLGSAGFTIGSGLGTAIGGQAGSFIGGTVGSMLPFMLMGKLLKNTGDAADESGPQLSKYNQLLQKIGMSATKFNLILGGVTLALGVGLKLFRDHQESLKTEALGYGLTADAAQKAGLKYVDLNSKMKEGIANSKALAEKNKLIYATLTQSNTPLKISIEEYRKLKEQVKQTMPEFIKLIDQTNRRDVGDLAVRLKAQFIAAGDSAENATKKVYALIEASNKKGMGFGAVGSKEFAGVQNQQDASAVMVSAFNAAKTVQSQAAAAISSLNAIDAAINQIIADSEKKAQKDKTNAAKVKTYNDAQIEQFKFINEKVIDQKNFTEDVINEIKKQNPELAKVLNVSDNIQSAWSKYRITLQGTTLDLSRMSGQAAIALANMNEAINAAVRSNLLGENGSLSEQNKRLQKLKDSQAALEKASKGQSAQSQINSRKEIDALNKKIDAINKEADARKKALQEQQQDEDIITQIKKKQIEYQDALTAGNMSAAAQAQLDIRSLTNQQQRTLAERSIEEKRIADIEPLQSRIEAINAANQKVADAASMAGDKLNDLSKQITDLEGVINNVVDTVSKVQRGFAEGGFNYEGKVEDLTALGSALKKAGKAPYVSAAPQMVGGKAIFNAPSEAQIAEKYLGMNKELAIATKDIRVNAQNIFVEGKERFSPVKVQQGTPVGLGVTTPSTVFAQDLIKAGFSTKKGTEFTDNYGNKYVITGTGISRSGMVEVKKKELGGPVKANMPYIVGEKRPELFIPKVDGTIIPNIPKFLNGILNVPYDMQAILHKGERVLSPSQAMAMSTDSSYTINVDNVTMNFAEAPANGKELFAQFKEMLNLENIKAGGRGRLIA